jgi:hypothetical protein
MTVVSLVLAGISVRYEGGGITFALGGGFTKWMFWCVVFLTLQPLLSWFSSFGVGVPLPGGGINSLWLIPAPSGIPAPWADWSNPAPAQRQIPL